jgi:two-component system, NarL family, nitrate/nitrite response regulator NarL
MRVAVFSGDPILGEGLLSLLTEAGGHEVVHIASHFGDSHALETLRPDVLIITEHFDDPAHQAIIASLREKGFPVILLLPKDTSKSSHEPDLVIYRSRGVGSLLRAVREVGFSAGRRQPVPSHLTARESAERAIQGVRLSPREWEVAELVARGMRNREIAETMGTSEENVKALIKSTRRALGCKNRTELAVLVRTDGGAG